MIKSRHAYKVLGLSLVAVLGLMAFSAAGAQAEGKGVYLVNGATIPVGTLYSARTAVEGLLGTLLTELSDGSVVKISCEEVSGSASSVVATNHIAATLSTTKCKVDEPKGCTIEEPIKAKVLALALLHTPAGGTQDTYIVFEPEEAGVFTTLHFSGKECIMPEEGVQIKGSLAAKDCQKEILVEKKVHLLTEVQGGLGLTGATGLLFGKKAAKLDGSMNVIVVHTTTGVEQNWSAH